MFTVFDKADFFAYACEAGPQYGLFVSNVCYCENEITAIINNLLPAGVVMDDLAVLQSKQPFRHGGLGLMAADDHASAAYTSTLIACRKALIGITYDYVWSDPRLPLQGMIHDSLFYSQQMLAKSPAMFTKKETEAICDWNGVDVISQKALSNVVHAQGRLQMFNLISTRPPDEQFAITHRLNALCSPEHRCVFVPLAQRESFWTESLLP